MANGSTPALISDVDGLLDAVAGDLRAALEELTPAEVAGVVERLFGSEPPTMGELAHLVVALAVRVAFLEADASAVGERG